MNPKLLRWVISAMVWKELMERNFGITRGPPPIFLHPRDHSDVLVQACEQNTRAAFGVNAQFNLDVKAQ